MAKTKSNGATRRAPKSLQVLARMAALAAMDCIAMTPYERREVEASMLKRLQRSRLVRAMEARS